jgi:hypothetical protein
MFDPARAGCLRGAAALGHASSGDDLPQAVPVPIFRTSGQMFAIAFEIGPGMLSA